MNIWIFNHYAIPPSLPGGTRHYDFAQELIRHGHRVTIFASSFHYGNRIETKQYGKKSYIIEEIDGITFVWIKTVPYRKNDIRRFLNMLSYTYRVWCDIEDMPLSAPDIIIGSSVHMFAVYAAYRIAKLFDVPFVMEIRDIWPQTLIDLGMSRYHPFVLLLGWLEKHLYQKAERIITLLPYAARHIRSVAPVDEKNIVWIPNGAAIDRNSTIAPHPFTTGNLNVVYAGALGEANNLTTLIESAQLLRDEPVSFHIVGDGPMKKTLENMSGKSAPDKVFFYGSLPKTAALSMIKGADVLYFSLTDSPVFRFGISSNKLFDYLSAGRPILFASNSGNNPVQEAGAGISVPAENPHAVAEGIRTFLKMTEQERGAMGAKGESYMAEHHDTRNLAARLEQNLTQIVYNYASHTTRHTNDGSF